MIALFPEFSKLNLESLEDVKRFTAHLPSYTEFNFTNMFVWDIMQPIMVCELNENLVVKFIDFNTKDYYYSLLGTNKINESIRELFKLSLSEGRLPELKTIPNTVIEHMHEDEDIEVVEDDTNHDYILSVEELSEYKSEKFREKRNMVNRFKEKYPNHEVKELDLSERANAELIRSVLQKWETKLGRDAVEIITEFAAIEKAILHSKELHLRCFATFVDGVIEAFTMFEHLDAKNVIMHFEKGNRNIAGIYEHQKHNLAKHLSDKGIETINYGQDLGYEGLRQSKMSYHPVRFHKKYTIRPRHAPQAAEAQRAEVVTTT